MDNVLNKKSVEEVVAIHDALTQEAKDLVRKKGHDYNRQSQAKGDTLFNMRFASNIGLVDNSCISVLVRLGDKFNRLVSLTTNPEVQAEVKSEAVRDTVVDVINYIVYLYIFYCELTQEDDIYPPIGDPVVTGIAGSANLDEVDEQIGYKDSYPAAKVEELDNMGCI